MKAWLQLIRPSNVLTAISDVLAGVAIACFFTHEALPTIQTLICVSLSSMCLYMGGIVYNDVFDAKLDRIERPERPIPRGRISILSASFLGGISFMLGCLLAYAINIHAFYIAIAIVLMCLLYNGKAKHHFILGPIVMGCCRGLNLLLGVAVLSAVPSLWYISIVPILYIAAVTNISRGEVYGNNKRAILVSLVIYSLVIITFIYFTVLSKNYAALLFLFLFVFIILSPLFKALKSLDPRDVKKSVKYGVLALILMNASWAAIAGFWLIAIFICATLPLSILLAKKYSVT